MQKQTQFYILILLTFFANLSFSQEKHLVVGTKISPPFVMENYDGTLTGISIDLWKEIADDLEVTYEFKKSNLQEMLENVETGKVDLAISAITVNAEREEFLDFSHSYYATGLGIAVLPKQKKSWFSLFESFLSIEFLKVLFGLSMLILVFGFLLWLFERKRNPGQFGESALKGIGSGFWWSAVTMTTVGYGDKSPITFGGRLVALVWMFVGIITISGFTAAITSSLTLSQFETVVAGPEDLSKVRVTTVEGSSSEIYLKSKRINYNSYPSLNEALLALSKGEQDAVVFDFPILKFTSNNDFNGKIKVLANSFESQEYAIALPTNSPLREEVNLALLRKIHSSTKKEIITKYFGQ
ncbi:MAG: ABC transporter substrate-binding protein [Calditrichaeota bacterium]|nr:MAG: ABC transporter substrate-binding protein [Calditrichota bacterium]